MSVDQPVLETLPPQRVNLEQCEDPAVSRAQIAALQESDIVVTKGGARSAGAIVRYTRLYNPNAIDDVTAVIGTGYLATDVAYKPFAIDLALRGRNVVLVKPTSHQALRNQLSSEHRRDVLLIQAQGKYAAMRTVGGEKYDCYGHSMDFDVVARVAEEKPKLIRSAIAAGGAGLIGQTSLLTMLGNGLTLVRKDIPRSLPGMRQHAERGLALQQAVHIAGHPIRRTREGLKVARADNRSRLQHIIENDDIRLGCILFEEDGCFGYEKVLKATHHLFDELIITPNATHMYPQDHPEEHAVDVANMLTNLKAPVSRLSA